MPVLDSLFGPDDKKHLIVASTWLILPMEGIHTVFLHWKSQ